MSQWQPGFQYPMQTGFPGGNQFQQNPQFQPQNLQFQPQAGLGIPNGGLVPQPTGFPGQRPQPLMQSGLPPVIQPQATGFPGGNFQQSVPPVPPLPAQFQQSRAAPPPVPPLPAQFQQNQLSFLNAPPQPNRLLSASPGFGGGLVPQQTGFPGQQSGGCVLVPQMTGFVDPRLQMMSQSFMPMNTSTGVLQLQPQPQNLVQSFQQHNQAHRGATTQQMSWALTKVEKKSYDNIFRQWVKGERFMSGPTAIEVFGASGLSKDDLARIWTLADIDDRGKLNLEEFHVAMGMIYRRLNGMQLPDQLPRELIPSLRQDLGDTVDRVKELLERESRTHSPSSTDSLVSNLKNRSFYGAAPSFESNRDATIYKHTDEESTRVYKPKWRHVDRDAIRSRDDDDNPSADLQDLKRRVANTAQMLDRTADADAQRTKEDEELAREMSDLNYRVKRIQEDLEFNSRGSQTASRANERRRLERELLSLMHERIPEVERKIKDREERKEREKRQWARDRDSTNERFGRYDNRDDYSRREERNSPYSRGEDRESLHGDRSRPYSRADDRPYSRADDRPSSRAEDRPYSRDVSDREDRGSRDRSYDRPRSPPTRSAPRPPPTTTSTRRATPPVQSQPSPSPSLAAMTPEQRKAYTQEQAKLRIQERMTKLGVISPSTSLTLDTSVEDRLQQEKKEAEERAKVAEKQAEERERARRERLENAKALKEGRTTPGVPTTPTPTSNFASVAPVPKPPAPMPTKIAPPPPKPRTRNAPAPPVRAPVSTPSARSPPVSVPKVAPSVPAPLPTEPEVDPEEEKLRAREEVLRKAREEREKARQERERKLKEMEMEEQERALQEREIEEQERSRQEQKRAMEEREKARQERERALKESEEQEAAAARLEEEQFQQRLESLRVKAMSSKPISPAITQTISPALAVPIPSIPDLPTQSSPSAQTLSPGEKSTNPFSRLLKEGGTSGPTTPADGAATTPNPWARPLTTPLSIPSPSRSPVPISSKTSYQTAPSSAIDEDWEDIKEKGDDDDGNDSSDSDELMTRSGRADIAQALFGNIRRPASAAPSSPAPTSSPPIRADSPAPPPPTLVPPPPPAAVPAPPTTPPAGRGALFAAIQGGKALRPTKTTDKSRPPLSGKVLGDSGPPSHISARPPSPPPALSVPALIISTSPETPEMGTTRSSKADNRQSVGWFSERAADLGGSPVIVENFPSTFGGDELNGSKPTSIPDVLVEEHPDSDSSLMADIDKSTVYRARSLYEFEGEGQEDLSFAGNIMIVVNPSKSGGDWWYGKLVTSGKSGLFPKTWVEVVEPRKARAVFSYTASKSDELSFTEGDTLDIVDTTEEEWWKAEQGGEVFMVPAGYLELVEGSGSRASMNATTSTRVRVPMTPINQGDNTIPPRIEQDNGTADSDSSSEYHSFEDGVHEVVDVVDDGSTRAMRERERQLVLEAAGLIVQTDIGAPLRRRSTKRRPAPPAPDRDRRNGEEDLAIGEKDLPPVPSRSTTPEPELSYEARLDDAFARYEAFKSRQATPNRLSVVSIESSIGPTSSPSSSVGATSNNPNVRESEGGRYSTFLNFLRSKTPDIDSKEARRKSASTWNISAPMIIQNSSSIRQNPEEEVEDTDGASFGMSWASLVDKTVLDEIPALERKRQESIFELINTENAYVRDLQLIVEVFYSTIFPLLSGKEITVVFANIEDILLTNTAFLSSLEKHQKECRLYIDRIGDILLSHIPNMGVYMEYCVNQSVAIKMLQSVRESKPELAIQLQRIRDDNPAVRNLDLSSYLLIPMQRITRYPLLIKQILHHTDVGKEHAAISNAREMAESLLDHINETIRDQENQETLKQMSQDLWIGHSRLDLTGATRNMGARRLLKEGVLFKAKSGRKLRTFLCSDILLLTDESIKVLYRLPIQLAYAYVKESSRSRDETGFQILQQNSRNGDTVSLRASTPRECQQWIHEISHACKKARQAEERAARLLALR